MGELKYLTSEEKNALDLLINKLRTKLVDQIVKIQLFGSKSRGDFTNDSDIDLLLVVRERTTGILDTIAEISLDVDLRYDPNISLIVFSLDEYNQNAAWETPFIKNIEKEGILL